MEHSDSERKIEFLSKALESEKVRLARWLTASCAFAVLISALAVLTKSAFFFAVAALAWFLVWNRWKCWTFVRAVVAKPLPSNDAERMQWIDGLLNVMENPPRWWRLSEYAAAAILMCLYAVISFFVITTSGTGMKVFYGISWAVIVVVIFFRVKDIPQAAPRSK